MAAQDAIGFIETQGLVGLLEAADTMCKAADVKIIGKEKIGAAYVTVMVTGDVAAVNAAVRAGAAAVERIGGKLILAHVIARPHDELAALLPK
ncbi:MAG TPA: BMC domain-containing protein [Phycisphaerae bacterium]|nr:BMC domain-containing protein [Phycisphaerae bacterium]HRY66919.1 BMC domain-containing protein [Phycisphaerae bacterium]HSA27867.1 BMC domain-containing protein [Phycisphaerae bacterium]